MSPDVPDILTKEERQWLADHPVIKVHNEKDFPPLNFFAAGRAQGFSIDYMRLLASKIGVRLEFVTGPTWSKFLGMMQSGELDIMLNIVRTPEREKFLLYTRPYASNPNSILSRKGVVYQNLETLQGKTVAVPQGFFPRKNPEQRLSAHPIASGHQRSGGDEGGGLRRCRCDGRRAGGIQLPSRARIDDRSGGVGGVEAGLRELQSIADRGAQPKPTARGRSPR